MFKSTFWVQAAERAVKSAAQALLGLWALSAGFNAITADWQMAGGVAAGAAVLSLMTSVVTSRVGEPDSPSAVEVD